MAKIDELAGELNKLNTQLGKAKSEIVEKVERLEGKLANTDLSEDAQRALDQLKESVQKLDDVVPDDQTGDLSDKLIAAHQRVSAEAGPAPQSEPASADLSVERAPADEQAAE